MDFGRREWLWLLLILPVVAVGMRWGDRRRRREWAALGQGGRPRVEPPRAWVLALACLVVAMAQPRWGRVPGSGLPPGHDVALVVDVSRSMAAEDAVPDRLGVAVESAEGLLAALGRGPGDQAAVVEFAGRAVVRLPLTENLDAAAEALRGLRPGEVHPGGTDLGAALATALDALGDEAHAEGRTIVLFSDGEDHTGTWPATLERLRQAGAIVHTIAIGDPERGAELPDVGGRPATYRGRPVVSVRRDEPLRAIARATGGAFVPLGLARGDLGRLYRERIAPVARRRREGLALPERVERYGLFVGAALVSGLIASWPWRGRVAWPFALMLLAGAAGPGRETPAEAVATGRAAYARRDFAASVVAFDRAIALDPSSAVARYDAAAALYRMGHHAEAAGRYREARDRAGPGLRLKTDYALGNTLFALGDVEGALRHYDACLASKVPGTGPDLVRSYAAINRRFVESQRPRPPAKSGDEGGRRVAAEKPRSPRQPRDRGEAGPPRGDASKQAPSPPGEPPPDADATAKARPEADSTDATGSLQSPERRLADALGRIRQAHRRRLETPPPASSGEVKDW